MIVIRLDSKSKVLSSRSLVPLGVNRTTIYSVKAIVSTALLLLLMLRIVIINKKEHCKQHSEPGTQN